MTRPRKALVCLDDTSYYHIVSRCVRRAFLCGKDNVSGKCYEHRRQWVEDRIHILASIFSIDIAAYAVMSNHYHIVLKLCPEQSEHWSQHEVLTRWATLFKGPLLVQRHLKGEPLTTAERQAVSDCADIFRQRLASLSWFMKCLNEPIAREANKEDNCTGHFFEGRFHSQALLTETALLSCMAYVDLNPVRASMHDKPEESEHTSIKERIQPTLNLAKAVKEQQSQGLLNRFNLPLKPLLAFSTNPKEDNTIPFFESDYIELVDYTGRCLRTDKRGAIPISLPPILIRLGLDRKHWLENSSEFEFRYQKRFAKRRRKINNTA